MNVVFAVDARFVAPLAAAMRSLFMTNPDRPITVYLIHTGIPSGDLEKLASIARAWEHRLVDCRSDAEMLQGMVTSYHFALANYLRLLTPAFVEGERALYLDSDVIVRADLQALYDTDLGNAYLGAVESRGFDRHAELEMDADARHFNSGVMLLNLRRWREEDVAGRVVQFVRRKPEAIQYVDQCGLNAVVNGRWVALHPRYDVQTDWFMEPYEPGQLVYSPEEMASALAAPAIVHFTGNVKPWHVTSRHPYTGEYRRHARRTPFRRPAAEVVGGALYRAAPAPVLNALRYVRRAIRFWP